MGIMFWLDNLTALLQIIVCTYMTCRYTKATHPNIKAAISSAVLALIYISCNRAVLLRAVLVGTWIVLYPLAITRIPRLNTVIYSVLCLFLMFIGEFPLDIPVLLACPEFRSLQDAPLQLVLIFRTISTPYFCFCYYLAWIICDRFFHNYTDTRLKRYLPFFVFQMFILVILIVICGLAFAAGANVVLLAICAALIVVFIIVMDFMLMHTFEIVEKSYQVEMAQQQTNWLLEIEAENYAKLQEQSRMIRMQKHDMFNQLQAIRLLLDNGETDSAISQIDSYYSMVQRVSPSVLSENAVVDAVLNTKQFSLQENGISFTHTGKLPAQLAVEPAILSSIVSNLMDNAINGCLTMPDDGNRFIEFSTQLHGTELLISCKNPAAEFDPEARKTPDLSKEHGWGLSILQAMTDRYEGRFDLFQDGTTVTATCWIPTAAPKEQPT